MLSSPVQFLSCDWGTSSFRLRLVSLPHVQVVASCHQEAGIAATWRAWQEQGGDRLHFYQKVILKGIQELALLSGLDLHGLPLVLSGMASATIGMMELPYASLPFPLDGSAALVQYLPPTQAFPFPCWLASGLRSDTDVMRGEETQLIGAMKGGQGTGLCIIPGTHSKHVGVAEGRITHFTTFMTGEIFGLLAQQSILAASVTAGTDWQSHAAVFSEGIKTGARTPILQVAFSVRTGQLFGKRSKEENMHYLSGLLIGAELAGMERSGELLITLIGNKAQTETYLFALHTLYPGLPVQVKDGDETLVRGQACLLEQLKGKVAGAR